MKATINFNGDLTTLGSFDIIIFEVSIKAQNTLFSESSVPANTSEAKSKWVLSLIFKDANEEKTFEMSVMPS